METEATQVVKRNDVKRLEDLEQVVRLRLQESWWFVDLDGVIYGGRRYDLEKRDPPLLFVVTHGTFLRWVRELGRDVTGARQRDAQYEMICLCGSVAFLVRWGECSVDLECPYCGCTKKYSW